MGIMGTAALVILGFVALRFVTFVMRAKTVANSAILTANKVKISIQIVQTKLDNLIEVGPPSPDKQFYIGYLASLAREQVRVDNQPLSLADGLISQELIRITCNGIESSSSDTYNAWLDSEFGRLGVSTGVVDGQKLADRFSSKPYFVQLDRWLEERSVS